MDARPDRDCCRLHCAELQMLSRYKAAIPRASRPAVCANGECILVIARRKVYWSIDLNWDVVEIECSELGVEKSGDLAEPFVKISPSPKLEHFYLLC
jgi:hypothetical protein